MAIGILKKASQRKSLVSRHQRDDFTELETFVTNLNTDLIISPIISAKTS